MRKLKPLPTFRGTTALGLLAAVKRAILAEPKRIHMSTFGDRLSPNDNFNEPPCGTVGCFAGWISILSGQGIVMSDIPAIRLLGNKLNYHTVGGFGKDGFGQSVFNSGGGDACAYTRNGTRNHAEAVVARIDQFIEFNRAALRRRKLPSLATRRRYAKNYEYSSSGESIGISTDSRRGIFQCL